MKRILVVDDEVNMCTVLKMTLEKDGYEVVTASSGEEAISLFEKNHVFDLIISDLKMPGIDGMDLLEYCKKNGKEMPIIFITAFGSIESAVKAMKLGAFDFITKPFNRDVIRHTVRQAFKIDNLENENKLLREKFEQGDFIYRSEKMRRVVEMVKKIANVSTPVLIVGESGTGKGLVARMIHNLGNRRGPIGGLIDSKSRPFIRINCPSIPSTLFESELFGFQKGAFTGATKDFKGKLRIADGGTVFFDEIADLPLNIQPKLLRVLEENSFEPLGSNTVVTINTRFICATNRDIKSLVESGAFREDLYYRINAITLEIPPLRERKEDIIPLAEYFLKKYSLETGKRIKGISREVREAFLNYHWPGNVRELKNIVERAVVLTPGEVIGISDITLDLEGDSSKDSMDMGDGKKKTEENGMGKVFGNGVGSLFEIEKQLLVDALKSCGWNVTRAARKLGITRNTLRYRMEKYGIRQGD